MFLNVLFTCSLLDCIFILIKMVTFLKRAFFPRPPWRLHMDLNGSVCVCICTLLCTSVTCGVT